MDDDANLRWHGLQRRPARSARLGQCDGPDAGSAIFYSRVKGSWSERLPQWTSKALVITRPSVLVGDRVALGQPERSWGKSLRGR